LVYSTGTGIGLIEWTAASDLESESDSRLRLRLGLRLMAAAIASLNTVTSTIVNRRS